MPDASFQFTVADLTARIVGVGAPDEVLLAGQIRNWSRNGLFGTLGVRGNGPTAAKVFDEKHLALALIFSVLARYGMDVRHLSTVARLCQNIHFAEGEHPVGKAYEIGLSHILAAYKQGDRNWRLRLYAERWGEFAAGGFTRDEAPSSIALSRFPLHLTLEARAIFGGLFPCGEEQEVAE